VQSIGRAVVDVAPGDCFELIACQTSGSPKNVAADELTCFAIEVVDKRRYKPVPERQPPPPPALLKTPRGRGGAAAAVEPARSSGIPAAQKLWHVLKTHLLELSDEGFWRRAAAQPATLAAL
jgi:hypothetical protein